MWKRDGCPLELGLLTCMFELAIAGRMNLGFASSEHIVWRYIADGTVQSHGVVVIYVGLSQASRIGE
jgi:hypothetical protein